MIDVLESREKYRADYKKRVFLFSLNTIDLYYTSNMIEETEFVENF